MDLFRVFDLCTHREQMQYTHHTSVQLDRADIHSSGLMNEDDLSKLSQVITLDFMGRQGTQ